MLAGQLVDLLACLLAYTHFRPFTAPDGHRSFIQILGAILYAVVVVVVVVAGAGAVDADGGDAAAAEVVAVKHRMFSSNWPAAKCD